ncbi:MAG: TRAP transporter small permease subunit [Burkholderiaceae bacterium]
MLAGVTILPLVVLAGVVLCGTSYRRLVADLVRRGGLGAAGLAESAGAALAYGASHAHPNFEGLPMSLPARVRTVAFVVGEAVFYGTFAIVLWFGWKLLAIFGDETMTSLPAVPLSLVQAIVPLGAALIVIARLLVTPGNWARVKAGTDLESQEIAAEIERARSSMAQAGFDTRT